MATLYVGSDQTYKTLQAAIDAASATEENTIIVSAGVYNEDIVLDARSMEQKDNIKFVAAEGEKVTFAGLITIGYYEKRVGSKKWDADVEFEGITFDQAANGKHSIDIQQCNDFAMTNCTIVGDGEYGILGTNVDNANVDNGATITGCTFENAAIQTAGSFGTNLLIDDCTFEESRINIQSGNSVKIQNSTFNCTLKDVNVGDSFYCVRSNDNAIDIEDTTFNIHSKLSEVATDQAKWGVLWQRNAGGTKWNVNDIEVNFTDAAMEQTELLFNKNGTTTAANEAGRITINNLTSNSNNVDDLLAKTEGIVNVKDEANGTYKIYDDGVVSSDCNTSVFHLNSEWTSSSTLPANLIYGINAFSTIEEITKPEANFAETTPSTATEIVFYDGEYELTDKNYFYSEAETVTFSVAENNQGNVTFVGEGSLILTSAYETTTGEDDKLSVIKADVKKPTFQINENLTLNFQGGILQVGQGLDEGETHSTGAAHVNIDGTVIGHVELANYSTMTVGEEGKLLNTTSTESVSVLRSNSYLLVDGSEFVIQAGNDQLAQTSMDLQGGALDLNSTIATINTLKLSTRASDLLPQTAAYVQVATSTLTTDNIIATDSAAKIEVKDDSTLTVTETLTNAGEIIVDDSTVTGGNIANRGTLKVSGESVIDATIENNGLVNITEITNAQIQKAITGNGTIAINDGSEFTTAADITADLVYVGYVPGVSTEDIKSTLTVAKDTTLKVTSGKATIDIRPESELNVAGTVETTNLLANGTVNVSGTLQLSLAAGCYGITVKTGEEKDFIVSGSVGITEYVENYSEYKAMQIVNDSVFTLTGTEAKADFVIDAEDVTTIIDINAGGIVIEDGAAMEAEIINNAGSITIDATAGSKLTATEINGTGTITIDATNFKGFAYVLDLSAAESSEGKVTIEGEGVTAIYGEDGDIVLSTVDTSTIFVNAEYTGEVGTDLGDGKYFGVNAFTSLAEALSGVGGGTEKIEIATDITEAAPAEHIDIVLSNDLTIAGIEGGVTVNWTDDTATLYGITFSKAEGVESATVNFENLTLNSAGNSYFTFEFGEYDAEIQTGINGVDVVIDGNSSFDVPSVVVREGSKLTVEEGSTVKTNREVLSVAGEFIVNGAEGFDPAAENNARQIIAWYTRSSGENANIALNDTYMTSYNDLRLSKGAEMTLDNSLLEVGKTVAGEWLGNPSGNYVGQVRMAASTLTASNNSIVRISGAYGADTYGIVMDADSVLNINSGAYVETGAGIDNAGTINIDNGELNVGTEFIAFGTQIPSKVLNNTGTINVSGESTLNIGTLTGNTIDFMDGAIIKDSTVGGGVFVAGNVTFRGDNTFGMITDFGTLTDYYGTTAPMAWTVEAGASVTLSNKARYGLGYGDKVVINGEIAENGAAAARATLTDDDADNDVKSSLFMHGLVAQESAGWNCNSSFTVNNAFVTIGSNSSFGSKAGNYGGNYTFSFNNSVLNSSRITFYNTNAKTTFTLTGSDVELGQFMTRDQDSVFTLDNSKLVSTSTINGNDEGQYNAGTLNLINGSTLTYSSAMTNEATGKIVISADSKLIAPEIIMVDGASITIDGTGFTSGTNKVIDLNINGSLKDAVTAENLGEGITLAYGKDGDVLITDANTGKLYVSQDYAGKEFGYIDGDKVVGVNAFGSLVDALDAKTVDTEEIVIESDIEDALSGKTISGKLTADSDVTITDSANSNYVNFTGTTLDENITVDAKYFYLYGENTFNGNVKSSSTFYSVGKLTMSGNAEVYTTMSRYYVNADDGIYVVGTAAAGEGKNAAVQYKSINYLGHYSGTFSVKDTAAEFGYILLNGDTDGDGYSKATLVADNASIKTIGGPNTQPGQVLMNGDASIVATNGSVLDFRGPKDFGYISMGANNSISLTDSEMYLGKDGQGSNTLAGKITLTNSKLNSLGKLNSTAAITIDATSSIVATTITGTGTITIDVKGYTGDTFKAIDVNSAIENTVKLTNASNKYYLTYGEDGDVYVNKSPDFVYVSSDYNSSTEGWGVTKFGSWDGAYAFTSTNAKKATIVFEKTTTISGNCFPKQADGVAAIIVKDGAAVGNANSKWDAVFAMTIEGGGILQSARPASAGYGNTHVKNKWIIGEAGADKQAKILFVNGKNGISYQTMSIALLSGLNRSITANNALIEVGDMGLQSNASFTDTTLTIEGILAIKGTGMYKTTMTDTEVTIKGHNLMNENTYYSTVGTILATLTMDNSSIEVDDKADTTAAEKVWLGYTGNVAQTLTMTNGSSITVEKDTEVAVANTVVMTDSSITAGNINAGDTKYAGSNSFYFNQLEKGKVYYAVLYDAEGNELETIVRTSTSGSTFYPKFSAQPAGSYTAKCFKDEAKTELHQEKTYTFTAVGTMDLTNSDLYAEKLTLAGNNVSMDIDSTIGFSSIEGGYITVKDAADYVDNAGVNDGTYKLFDYTGTGAMIEDDYYKALLNNVWHDNYKVINSDLYLTDQDTSTIYVNSAWAGAEEGDIVGDYYIYGFNAAGSLEEIGSMIATDGSDTTIKFESDIEDGSVDFTYGGGDITFTADSAVTIKQTSVADWTFVVGDVAPTITIGKNVTFEVYENASGLYVYYGAGLNVEGTITGGANWGCTYLAFGEHTVASTGTISTGRVHMAWSELTVNGDAESDRTDAHIDTNYLLVEDGVFTANNAIIDAGAVHDSNNGGLRYGASEFYIKDSAFTANTVTLKYADSVFNVTGESQINIGTLTGAIDIEDADLTASSINKGSVNFKGENTFAGDFNANYAFVGDWNNEEYDGSVDFGTESNVNVGGQMIIGYDTLVPGANNVVFGDTTGAVTTDKVFKAADVSVRRDGTLSIANTTGENKINTMNVMGSVVIDNAKLTGEVQIGNNSDDIDAVMTVQNGAEVTLGGSSNSIVILGKSTKGTLNVDNATVTVKRCGPGASYKVPADTFVIGYNGGVGILNVNNGGSFEAVDYNGDKDGGKMNVQLGTGSEINVSGNGSVEIAGNVANAGSVVVEDGNFTAGNMDLLSNFTLSGLTDGDARTITVAFMPAGESEGGFTKEIEVGKSATSVSVNFADVANGKYDLTVIDGANAFTATTEIVNGTLNINGGSLTLDTLSLNKGEANVSGSSELNGKFTAGKVNFADGTVLTSTTGAVFDDNYTVGDMTFGAGEFEFNGLYISDVALTDSAKVTVKGTFGMWDNEKLTVGANAELIANSIYFNGGSMEIAGTVSSLAGGDDGGFILNGKDDVVTVKAGGNLNVTYVDAYKSSASTTVDVYGAATVGFKLSDGSGKFTWNLYAGASLTAGKYGIVMNNSKSEINLTAAELTFANLDSAGTITLDVNSVISFAAIANAGTITIDMSDINNAIGNKLFDYTGSDTAAWDLDAYKAILGNSSSEIDKFLTVEDGDLIVKSNAVVYVNGSYTDAANNQYKTFEEAIESGAGRIITTNDTISSAVGYDDAEGIIEDGTYNGTVSGGAITESEWDVWEEATGDTNLTIEGGEFNKHVIGAERVEKGASYRDGDSNLTIKGGTFNMMVVGGMAYVGDGGDVKDQAALIGDVNLTIEGGTFNNWIYGGSLSKVGYSTRTTIEGNITVKVNASENVITFGENNKGITLVAGSYQHGLVEGSTQVIFTGKGENLATLDKADTIWGGSSADVYMTNAKGKREFDTMVTGDRTFTFDNFNGKFGALIRGFETLEVLNGSVVEVTNANLDDIKVWNFDTESTFTGSLGDLVGDTLNVDITDWDQKTPVDLISGDLFSGVPVEDMTVTLGGQTAEWDADISGYASASYKLAYNYNAETGTGYMQFSNKLA